MASAQAVWLDVWARAVVVPAFRRAGAVWVGCAIVAAVVFGPQGLTPGALTMLAFAQPAVGAVLVVTWLLVFAPTARLLVRAEAASYLRSLPHPTWMSRALAGAALVALQLPWVVLWVAGEGAFGLVVVAGSSLALVALASWRPPRMRAGWPGWRDDRTALRSIHLRALRRRAGDALVRGAGLAILAGAAAGLFIRNNQLAGEGAAPIGASVIAVVLVPAEVGVLLVILATHAQTAWLAASLGISRVARVAAVTYAIAVVQLGATAVAVAAAIVVAEPDIETALWLGGTSAGMALASSLGCTRVLLGAEDSPTIASRTVAGSVVVAAGAVVCLGLFGPLGVAAFFATCLLAMLGVTT